MNKDLTVGKPEMVLRSFCLPLFGSILFQQLYNIADSFVAGKFINEDALAAVGNSYEITLIFLAFAFGCNIGCSVITSMYFGAKNYAKMKTAVFTSLIGSAVLCAVLMAFGIGFCDDLLRLIRTPSNVFADSKLYLDIYVWGLPFVFFYNIANGIFTALGDSKTPFYFLAVSSVSNIGMDILFVAGFHMGVAGVAWATFLCQGVSCVLAMLVVLLRLRGVRTEKKYAIFSWKICGDIAKIAIPSTLQQSFISVGNIVIQGMINGFGSGVMAGYAASVKLNNLVITSFTTLGNGISNYAAQNMGAGKMERIPAGFKAGLKLVWTIAVPIVALYLIFGKYLVWFFMDEPSEMAMSSGLMFLRIVAPFYFVAAVKLTADGVLRGTSMMGKFMIATFTDLILRVVLAYILSGTGLASTGIWCAWPIGWTVSTVLSLLFYLNGPWKVHKEQNEKEEHQYAGYHHCRRP
uniref:MATE family efflux transporter n=1 Tax=Eubacterium cellulosolvens TaxID=29322 RepID=UPI0006878705|nr:MATE family efflux transporter [[Eubacterium] cellulosolvens]